MRHTNFRFSGADLAAVLRQAVLFLLEEYRQERPLSFEVDVAMEDGTLLLDRPGINMIARKLLLDYST